MLHEGLHRQAISRAFYGAFYAVRQVLAARAADARTHRGTVQAFSRVAKEDAALGQDVAKTYASLAALRERVDYLMEPGDVPRERAERAIADARKVVEACERALRK